MGTGPLTGEMEILVRFFGPAREAAGQSAGRYHVPPGATVEDLARRLAEAHPELEPHLARCSFALNESYAGRRTPLGVGDELAVIPPIGGG
ncbi:MAG TPA: MoaD/ThiS family protein [Gemmatimonadota bacterium]|jgi:molybdopterin synthase catalytic subunit